MTWSMGEEGGSVCQQRPGGRRGGHGSTVLEVTEEKGRDMILRYVSGERLDERA